MNRFTKLTVGAGAAALAALTAASPAQAQYYPQQQNGGIDVGQIVRGVAVAGAVSAAVGAITNAVRGGVYGSAGNRNGGYGNGGYGTYPNTSYPSGGYGYPTTTYPNSSYPNSSYPSGGYGYPTGGNAYPGGYGVQANGYASFESAAVNACGAQAQRYGRASVDNVERRGNSSVRVRGMIEASAGVYGGGIERRTFDCSFRNDGRVTQFETNKVRY